MQASSRARPDARLGDLLRYSSSVLLPADILQQWKLHCVAKPLCCELELKRRPTRVLHTVNSPERVWRWSYPAKRVSKTDDSIITYQHSSDKHLENTSARRARDGFLKKSRR
jgi:hypothetical protein